MSDKHLQTEEFWNEVRAWKIEPLKYATPQGFEININRQELAFYDTSLLADPDLNPLEVRLMIDICTMTSTDFLDLIPSEGFHGYVVRGLEDPIVARDTLLSLRERGYISL